MNQRELENSSDELDAFDTESGKIAALLSALPRVEAPANFEFRVKAGIAERSAPRSSMPFLKFAAPLTLVLFVTAFLFYYGTMPTTNAPTVVENTPATEAPSSSSTAASSETPPLQVSASNAIEPMQPTPDRASAVLQRPALPGPIANNSPSRRDRRGGSIDMPLGGGSRDAALGAPKPIQPRGLGGDIPVRDVFETIGITADFAEGGWKVRSAAEGGIGHRSGMQAGDVIESIDGRRLTESTSFKDSFSGKTFRVRRGGKQLDLTLQN